VTTYRLWPATNGPSTPSAYSGNFISGVAFCVTAEAWFTGYWWWVCATGQATTAVKCALWCTGYITGVSPVLVPGSVVTSGALTAGQWNYIPLATPVALSLGGSSGMSPAVTGPSPATYVAAVGCNGSFPDTNNYWGAGQTEPDGITSGPLTAFSGKSASMPAPWPTNVPQPQGCFSVGGSDPSVTFPGSASNTDNFWVDVQVGDDSSAPSGASYRIWPGFPVPQSSAPAIDTGQQTMGTEFSLSESCTLDNIWFYSPPGVTVLPSRCGIWNVSTQTEVSGTDNSSPSWTGAAGSGWVACAYTGVTLPAGDYKVAVYYGGGSEFYTESNGYFSANGPGQNGVSNGPLTAPNTANATGGIQDTFTSGAWAYPAAAGGTGGQARFVDVEVTPAGGGPVTATLGTAMAPMALAVTGTETVGGAAALAMAPMKLTLTGTETGVSVTGVLGTAMAPMGLGFGNASVKSSVVPSLPAMGVC
jgi:hypothetical protein